LLFGAESVLITWGAVIRLGPLRSLIVAHQVNHCKVERQVMENFSSAVIICQDIEGLGIFSGLGARSRSTNSAPPKHLTIFPAILLPERLRTTGILLLTAISESKPSLAAIKRLARPLNGNLIRPYPFCAFLTSIAFSSGY
jgi:hypothetical protein